MPRLKVFFRKWLLKQIGYVVGLIQYSVILLHV